MASPQAFREIFAGAGILWQTRTAAYCIGIDEFVPLALVLSLDDGSDLDLIEQRTGIRFLSREKVENLRRGFGDEPETYVLHPTLVGELQEYLRRNSARQWIAASPYPSLFLREFAASAGLPCWSRDWREFRHFSSKRNLKACLEELELPRLPANLIRLRQTRYSEIASQYGAKLVLQLDESAAGLGTAVISSAADFDVAVSRFRDAEVWVSPYAGCLSLNVNAVATDNGTVVGYPNVQIVGQPILHSRPGGHCGNDFTAAAALPGVIRDSIREQTTRIGDWMVARGYRGLFGLDFVVDESCGAPCAVDLNPRWQGSTSLQAQAESRQGRLPLAAAELALQLGFLQGRELVKMADLFCEPLVGGQAFLRSPPGSFWRVRGALKAGAYSFSAEYLRPALRLADLNSTESVVMTGGVPRLGRRVQPGAGLLRLCGLQTAVDPTNGSLLPWLKSLALKVYNLLELEMIEELD